MIAYDYDAGGLRVQEAVTVDGSTYVTVSAFDAGGRLTSRVYPDSTGYPYDFATRITATALHCQNLCSRSNVGLTSSFACARNL